PVIPDDEKSFQVRSEATRKPRDKKEGTLNKIMTTKTQTKREMEDIPAFMRRDRSKNKQKSDPQQISSTKNEDQKEEPVKIYPHTKPDELDAVFKKRDRKPEQVEREVEHSKEELAPNTLSNHHHGSGKKYVINDLLKSNSQKEDIHVDKAEKDELTHIEYQLNSPADRKNDTDSTKETTNYTKNDTFESENSIYQMQKNTQNETVSIQQPVASCEKVEDISLEPDVPEYLLNDHGNESMVDEDWLIEQQILLEDTFTHFNIDATVVNVTQGPSVTRFEIQPALGVKVSKIKNLSDDLKLNLAARDIRIEAPIPGKNTIGIEIPNKTMHLVNLQEIFESNSFKDAESPLTVALGLTIEGSPIVTNIDEMPHGLIAG